MDIHIHLTWYNGFSMATFIAFGLAVVCLTSAFIWRRTHADGYGSSWVFMESLGFTGFVCVPLAAIFGVVALAIQWLS